MFEWLFGTIFDNTAKFRFESPQVLFLGLPFLVFFGWFVHRRLRKAVPDASRLLIRTLLSTRLLVLTTLILILADPVSRFELDESKRPLVALLLDTSSSMSLKMSNLTNDEEKAFARLDFGSIREQSRIEVAMKVLERLEPTLFGPIRERFDFRRYAFSTKLEPLAESPSANGSATHLGSAIIQLFEESKGIPLAGVIVVSDGENTGGGSVSEATEIARRTEVPIFAVPIGSTNRFRDVSVVEVSTSGEVSIGDTARIGVVIESQGFDGESATLRLLDGEKVVQSKSIHLRDATQQQVEMLFPASEEGGKYLRVEVVPLQGEAIDSNNTEAVYLRVAKGKRKVLHLEGPPRWDFRFLKNGLRRDSGLEGLKGKQVDLVLENEWRLLPETVRADKLPKSVEEFAEYDCIIVGDVSPKLLDETRLNHLAKAVREKGVGLLVQAGTQSMPHAYGKELRSLLPIQLQDNKPGLEAPVGKPFTIELSRDGLRHETMRLHDEPERARTLWGEMLPYSWCAAGVKPSPGATVLAWNPTVQTEFGKLPLIAWHQVGQGRVMFVGTDSTWLWRQNIGERFFMKFWRQSVRFVARQDQMKRSRVEVFPPKAQPGDEIDLELLAYTESGEPLRDGKLTHRSPEGETPVSMTSDRNRPGRFTGSVRVQKDGIHEFVHTPEVKASLLVRVSPEEMRRPNANRPVLRSLADGSAGQLIELTDPVIASKILDGLKGETKSQSRTLRTALWDNSLVLFLLVGLFCFDIAVRRFAGLS